MMLLAINLVDMFNSVVDYIHLLLSGSRISLLNITDS